MFKKINFIAALIAIASGVHTQAQLAYLEKSGPAPTNPFQP